MNENNKREVGKLLKANRGNRLMKIYHTPLKLSSNYISGKVYALELRNKNVRGEKLKNLVQDSLLPKVESMQKKASKSGVILKDNEQPVIYIDYSYSYMGPNVILKDNTTNLLFI